MPLQITLNHPQTAFAALRFYLSVHVVKVLLELDASIEFRPAGEASVLHAAAARQLLNALSRKPLWAGRNRQRIEFGQHEAEHFAEALCGLAIKLSALRGKLSEHRLLVGKASTKKSFDLHVIRTKPSTQVGRVLVSPEEAGSGPDVCTGVPDLEPAVRETYEIEHL